jgi:uncharacterized protein (TIGR00730 family)
MTANLGGASEKDIKNFVFISFFTRLAVTLPMTANLGGASEKDIKNFVFISFFTRLAVTLQRKMISDFKKICVFCASSSRIDKKYVDAAYELGRLFSANEISCVCGAGREGLMKAVTDGTIDSGGHAIGIIPQFMVDNGWHYPKLSEIIVTDDMHSRKQSMADMADAVIALPGGCGTLEELLEIITWKQLGIFGKPIIILNTDGFFDDLLRMLSHCINEGFMKPSHSHLWHVAGTPAEAIAELGGINIEEDAKVESKY